MRDEGLSQAILAAGGVSELARKLGISQPSVSNWTRVPVERVISVETLTGVDRIVLRPDLYAPNGKNGHAMHSMRPGQLSRGAGGRETRILGLAGWSGSGKTTLLTQAIPALRARGLTVSTLKHAHHEFDLDQPGKDSYVHRTAGATEVLISSARRWAVLHELRDEPEWSLAELVAKFSPVDLILVEGYKRDRQVPKVEIHRVAVGKPLLFPEDPSIAAIACDSPLLDATVPVVDLNDIEAVTDAMLAHAQPLSVALQVHP